MTKEKNMPDEENAAYQTGVELGQGLMRGLIKDMEKLAVDLRAVRPVQGDPGAVYRAKLGLLEQGLVRVHQTEATAHEISPVPLPAEVAESFEEIRRPIKDAQQTVQRQLAQACGPMN